MTIHKKTTIKTPEQIFKIREAGKYSDEILSQISDMCKIGTNLLELESYTQNFLDKNNLKGAFKGYQGYPANLCLSLNDCVVHGIPYDRKLKENDVLKIDLGVDFKGGISDSAITIVLSKNKKYHDLVSSTKKGLDEGLEFIGPFQDIYDFGACVYSNLISSGFQVIKNLVGHGVGNSVHEGPYIYNYPNPDGKNVILEPGMVIALEPITALKSQKVFEKPGNHWNLYTQRGDVGAQREYTVLITDNGCEVIAGLK